MTGRNLLVALVAAVSWSAPTDSVAPYLFAGALGFVGFRFVRSLKKEGSW